MKKEPTRSVVDRNNAANIVATRQLRDIIIVGNIRGRNGRSIRFPSLLSSTATSLSFAEEVRNSRLLYVFKTS